MKLFPTTKGLDAYIPSVLSLKKKAKEFVDVYFETSFESGKQTGEIVVGGIEHQITSFDAHTLKAYEIKANDKNKFVISICDYRQDANEMINLVREFDTVGINNIVIPQRLDPNAITKSVFDLSLWLDYFLGLYPNAEIVLYGEGYGANTIIKYLQTEVAANIKACILDNLNTRDILDKLEKFSKKNNLNALLLTNAVDKQLQNRFGYKLKDLALINILANNLVPLCFIYNKEKKDYTDVLRIYNSGNFKKNFFYTSVEDRNQNQENFFPTIIEYVQNRLK